MMNKRKFKKLIKKNGFSTEIIENFLEDGTKLTTTNTFWDKFKVLFSFNKKSIYDIINENMQTIVNNVDDIYKLSKIFWQNPELCKNLDSFKTIYSGLKENVERRIEEKEKAIEELYIYADMDQEIYTSKQYRSSSQFCVYELLWIRDYTINELKPFFRKIDSGIGSTIQFLQEYIQKCENLHTKEENGTTAKALLKKDFLWFAVNMDYLNDIYKEYNEILPHSVDNFISFYNTMYQNNILEECRIFSYSAFNLSKAWNFGEFIQKQMRSFDKNEQKKIIESLSDSKINLPTIFLILDDLKGKDEETDDYINKIISENKKEYALWLYSYDNGRSTFAFSNYLRRVTKWSNKEPDAEYSECVATLIDELLNMEGKKYTDIEFIKGGSYSNVYKIGEKIIKLGGRSKIEIPNHRRILQPIIRQTIGEKFVEITQNVNTEYVSTEDVWKIYLELLNDGIVWKDPAWENIGCLLKSNIPEMHGVEQYSDPNATNMTGKTPEESLQAGEYVVIDTDHLYSLEKLTERFSNLDELLNFAADFLHKGWRNGKTFGYAKNLIAKKAKEMGLYSKPEEDKEPEHLI